MEKDVVFKLDRQKETALLTGYDAAKKNITTWAKRLPDKEWGSAMEEYQLKELDDMYENH